MGGKVFMETLAADKCTQSTVGGTVSYPAGVATDTHGDLYIAETGDNRVLKVPATDLTCAKSDCKQIAANLATHLSSPSGVDGRRNRYTWLEWRRRSSKAGQSSAASSRWASERATRIPK
jgi:hypothetical protein